jgi:hypothetical protein
MNQEHATTELEVIEMITQFAGIAKEIETQREAIICKFNINPEFIVLGTEPKQIIDRYFVSQVLAVSTFRIQDQDIIKPFMEMNFGLTPVISQDVPKNFIQVVVPRGAYL